MKVIKALTDRRFLLFTTTADPSKFWTQKVVKSEIDDLNEEELGSIQSQKLFP